MFAAPPCVSASRRRLHLGKRFQNQRFAIEVEGHGLGLSSVHCFPQLRPGGNPVRGYDTLSEALVVRHSAANHADANEPRNDVHQQREKLLEALLFEVAAEKRQDIQIFKTLIHQHSQRLAYYQCEACGFKARQFFWRCPACVAWETFPPRRIEERAP